MARSGRLARSSSLSSSSARLAPNPSMAEYFGCPRRGNLLFWGGAVCRDPYWQRGVLALRRAGCSEGWVIHPQLHVAPRRLLREGEPDPHRVCEWRGRHQGGMVVQVPRPSGPQDEHRDRRGPGEGASPLALCWPVHSCRSFGSFARRARRSRSSSQNSRALPSARLRCGRSLTRLGRPRPSASLISRAPRASCVTGCVRRATSRNGRTIRRVCQHAASHTTRPSPALSSLTLTCAVCLTGMPSYYGRSLHSSSSDGTDFSTRRG